MATAQVVTPFDVSGGTDEHGQALAIDYDKLVDQFGCRRIDAALLQRFERVTGHRPHRLLRRGLVFSHRDLDDLLNKYEAGTPFYLYTGRGPSSDSMHVGHTIPFDFTKWLQAVFDVPLVIMLTDDEKFYHNRKLARAECHRFALQNAADIIGIGFDPARTFLFIDTDFLAHPASAAYQANVDEVAKRTTINQISGTFGFDGSNNLAEYFFPARQSATAYAASFPFLFPAALAVDRKRLARVPCLIPCAIDQDPYFRQCREHARPLGHLKPALLHAVFLPGLRGRETKMSASDPDSSVFLSDTDKQIQRKINKAFSGGQQFEEDHKRLGGRTDVDVPFQYLRFFLDDDDELEGIRQAYEKGELSSGRLKARCIEVVQAYVRAFRERRAQVTDAVRDEFLRPRELAAGRGGAGPDGAASAGAGEPKKAAETDASGPEQSARGQEPAAQPGGKERAEALRKEIEVKEVELQRLRLELVNIGTTAG